MYRNGGGLGGDGAKGGANLRTESLFFLPETGEVNRYRIGYYYDPTLRQLSNK
jgi:hypothetical protein